MINSASKFEPNWHSSPAKTIRDVMSSKGLSIADLAEGLNCDESIALDYYIGSKILSITEAGKLSKTLGGSREFWVNRQTSYLDDLRRCAKQVSVPDVKGFLSDFPIAEMKKRGWLSSELNTIEACLSYFDVSNVEQWKSKYGGTLSAVAFRRSETFQSENHATVSWLRRGEILAQSVPCRNWNQKQFIKSLSKIRSLTKLKSPASFIPRLVQVCSDNGVAVIFSKAPKGCTASGATKFLNERKALMMLSFRHLSDDHFWFTFFHEAGHLALHGQNALFLESKSSDTDHFEEEANAFAKSILVPDEAWKEFASIRPTIKNVIRMAVRIGISPGILVGQLQHKGLIGYSQLNGLKRRYKWDELPIKD